MSASLQQIDKRLELLGDPFDGIDHRAENEHYGMPSGDFGLIKRYAHGDLTIQVAYLSRWDGKRYVALFGRDHPYARRADGPPPAPRSRCCWLSGHLDASAKAVFHKSR